MIDDTSDLIGDLFEVNRKVSQDLWNVTDTNSKPSVWSPRVVFPPKRDGSVRVSEQEARIICCGLLNNLNLYYSVETPTEKTYIQKGKKKEGMSAQTDLAIYSFDGQRFTRVINIEFKAHNCNKRDIAKDVEKLVREGITGNWFHILEKVNAGTFPNLFEKFRYSFMKYPDEKNLAPFSSTRISILFCFCVLQKEQAYVKHFSYKPSSEQYREYVKGFFNPTQLNVDSNWHLIQLAATANTKNRRRQPRQTSRVDSEIVPASKRKCERLWEDGADFTIVEGTKGSSARHKNKPRLWFLPEYFQIAPQGKSNDMYKVLCETLHNNFTDIRGESRVLFSSQDFSWDKFENFVADVKNICR